MLLSNNLRNSLTDELREAANRGSGHSIINAVHYMLLHGLGPATTADGRGLSRLRELICGGFQKSLAVYTVFKYLELALWERQ